MPKKRTVKGKKLTDDKLQALRDKNNKRMREYREKQKLGTIDENKPVEEELQLSKREKKLAAQRERMRKSRTRVDADTVVGDTPSTASEDEGTPLHTSEYGGTPSTTSEYGWTPSTTSEVESTSSLRIEEQGMPSSPCEPQGMSSIPPSIEGTQSSPPQLNIDEIGNVEMYVPKRTPPRILRRKPKFLINIDDDILQHMEGKIPERTCRRYADKIWQMFFERLNETARCQLFVQMMRGLKYRNIMKTLGLRTSNASSENTIVKNLMDAYDTVGKTSRSKDSNVTRRVITSTVVSYQTKRSRLIKKTSEQVGISRKTLSKAVQRRQRIEGTNSNELWAFSGRLPHKDKKVVEALRTLIEDYWKNNTRPSPNQKDVVRRRIGSRNREPHPKHFLDTTQTQFFHKFQNDYPQISISQRFFEMIKPFYVKINHTRTTCCCKLHIEFSNHFDVYRSICLDLHTNDVLQDCGIEAPPKSSRKFLSKILCEIEDGQIFYRIACLDGSCEHCGGLQRMPVCEHMESTYEVGQKLVEFGKYKTVAYGTKDGSEVKRCELVIQKIPVYQFISMFRENLVYEYARHTHRARWLDMQFKLCKDTFPLGSIVSVVDFAENYTLQPQREVQSQYYNSTQVSIFVHIAFIHATDSTEDERKVLREYHFYISDDRTHSPEFVQGCFQMFYNHLAQRGISYDRHIIWSDNCAAQFKNARMFYWLCRMHLTTRVQHMWNFCEAGHGKGEHDGAGACVKRALAREELKYQDSAQLTDARSIVQWCNSSMGPGNEGTSSVRRFFWLMDDTNIAPYEDCCTLTGSSELHSFLSSNAGSWSIDTRKMACFCSSCTMQAWNDCESGEWVDKWLTSYLSPLHTYRPPMALELTQMESSVDFDHVSDLVQPGHVYAVIADEDNEEGTDYYLCRCVEAKKKLEAPIVDGENIEYPTGSVVLTGTWLRRYPHKSVKHWLFEEFDTHRKILHYSNLVVASNVRLTKYKGRPLNKTLWKVCESDHEAILDTIKSRADPDGSLD